MSPWGERAGAVFRNCYTLRCDFLKEAVAEAFQFAAIYITDVLEHLELFRAVEGHEGYGCPHHVLTYAVAEVGFCFGDEAVGFCLFVGQERCEAWGLEGAFLTGDEK